MSTKQLANLEAHMEKFIEEMIDQNEEPEGLFYPDIQRDMAKAAAMVLDACFLGQSHAEKEGVS